MCKSSADKSTTIRDGNNYDHTETNGYKNEAREYKYFINYTIFFAPN